MGTVSHSFLEKSKKVHDDDDDDYFNIMFYCYFLSKHVMTSVLCQNYSKFSYYFVLGAIFFYTLLIFFHYFGHHCRYVFFLYPNPSGSHLNILTL